MKKSRVTTVFVSVVLVLALVAGLMVATYALFSDQTRVNNHLQAGTLQIELYRTNLTYTDYDAEGGKITVDEDVNLTTASEATVFASANYFPGMVQTAELKIVNNGSLPFDYELSFTIDEENAQSPLAELIFVKVTDADGKVVTAEKTTLADMAKTPVDIGSMNGTAGESETFTVEISFDENANDSVQQAEIYFDILVTATQANPNA